MNFLSSGNYSISVISNLEIQKASFHRLSCSPICFVTPDRGSNVRFIRLNGKQERSLGTHLRGPDFAAYKFGQVGKFEDSPNCLADFRFCSVSVFWFLPDMKCISNPVNAGGSWGFKCPGLQAPASHSFVCPTFWPHKALAVSCTVLWLPGKWWERQSELTLPLQQHTLTIRLRD